jgi:broad specificity phosphatase PhoE
MTQTHIILVRHGEAASSWSQHPDPGLSSDGAIQAKNVSEEFTEKFSSYELLSSPKSRAIETMEPIALKQKRDFTINNNFISYYDIVEMQTKMVDNFDKKKLHNNQIKI